ncbi:MAG: hypothetical protein AAF922_16720, partial [Pseudomonadota bacterium]
RGIPCPISTSTRRNFETISSGFGRLFAILGPPFPKHNVGPVQLGRLNLQHDMAKEQLSHTK